ncbi:MAG: DoxX family protein [Gemmatimonadetes bacterium]|nr:DoxX family protein [Gemmatimonadota bacterium]
MNMPRRGPIIVAIVFVSAGILHFVIEPFYLAMMPPWLPAHARLVQVSGIAEIVLGLGVLVDGTRRAAGWGLLALLVAVFPANVQMLLDAIAAHASTAWITALVARLPLQWVIGQWVWRVTLRRRAAAP